MLATLKSATWKNKQLESALHCDYSHRRFGRFESPFNGLKLTFSVFVNIFFFEVFFDVEAHPSFSFVVFLGKSVVLC